MAEIVQLHIERTINELEQMERLGLFSRDEIKKIIQKRKDYEYTLRRRKKSKEDFLKYIQYEIFLLSLIGKRRVRLGCDLKVQEVDQSIARRINKLFKIATQRYQDDAKLWLGQIDFCKRMQWNDSISGLFSCMLQIHNSTPGFWVMAAKWEMEECNAPENARQLLQRALRHHPKSELLWIEYFRMELMYTDLVLKRRVVLGLQEIKDDNPETDAVLEGTIALVVYKNATSAIQEVTFALSFVPICQQFNFTAKHIDEIFADVERRHPEKEETLDVLAKRPLLQLNEEIKLGLERGERKKDIVQMMEEKVCHNYEEALKVMESEKMWSFYIQFALQRIKSAKKEKKQKKFRSHVLSLLERAANNDCLTYGDYIEWTRLLYDSGDEENGLKIALAAARKWEKKVSLWHLCLTLHIQSQADDKVIFSLLTEALGSVREKESFPLWLLGIRWLPLSGQMTVEEFLQRGIQGRKEISVPLQIMYLELTALEHGVQDARYLYKRLCQNHAVALEFHKKMIEIENNQEKPSIALLRKCYEKAIREFGSSDVELWMNYLKLEMEHPDGETAKYGMLYWRGKRTLDAEYTDEFVTRTTLYSTGHAQTTDWKLVG